MPENGDAAIETAAVEFRTVALKLIQVRRRVRTGHRAQQSPWRRNPVPSIRTLAASTEAAAWNADMPADVGNLATRSESDMGNLAWVILAFGASLGGLMMVFGFRKADARREAFGQIDGALKEDWRRTGNIDFRLANDTRSPLRPLRLWVEEKRITESAVGQDVVELRWRLATVEEGKELITCWNNAKLASPYDIRRAWQISNERNSPAATGQV